jgi:hypothetical protein
MLPMMAEMRLSVGVAPGSGKPLRAFSRMGWK